MNPVPWLQMTNMISYQGLVRTFPNRGKISEEDTTETPMYVNRGGRLTILQEDQGQLLTLAGEPDGKLRAAGH